MPDCGQNINYWRLKNKNHEMKLTTINYYKDAFSTGSIIPFFMKITSC
jgi:hypothetical protein